MNHATKTLFLDMLNTLAALSYAGLNNNNDKAELDATIKWFAERMELIENETQNQNK